MSAGSAFTPNIGKAVQRLHVQEQQVDGLNSATLTAGAWNTREINTVLVNEVPGASVNGSNQIILPAGTYRARCRAQQYDCEQTAVRLQNITLGTTIDTGESAYTNGGGNVSNAATLETVFVLTATTTVELQHRVTVSIAGNPGVGHTSWGIVNRFAEVVFEREIPAINDGNGELVRGPMVHYQDRKPQSSDGGTSTADTWVVRDLNTILQAGIVGASLSGNQVTLPAGDYEIEARAPCFTADRGMCRWWNDTDSSEVLLGSEIYNAPSGSIQVDSVVNGRFSISAPKVFELQHIVRQGTAGQGFGVRNFDILSLDNIYSEVRIWKLVRAGVQETDPSTKPLLHIVHEVASGSNGGTSSVGWNTRPLNVIRTNEISGASLSANQIILPAGTYYATGWSNTRRSQYTRTALYNVTDATYILDGEETYVAPSDSTDDTQVSGRFTLLAQKTVELRTYCAAGLGTTGLGIAHATAGRPEVYGSIEITKLD